MLRFTVASQTDSQVPEVVSEGGIRNTQHCILTGATHGRILKTIKGNRTVTKHTAPLREGSWGRQTHSDEQSSDCWVRIGSSNV